MSAGSLPFGDLLREHRAHAGLTQEALAERAGLSVHGVQKLERGVTHPHRSTVQLLLAVLNLSAPDQADFLAASQLGRRGKRISREDLGAARETLPLGRDTFVGRDEEFARLRQDVLTCRLLTLSGVGGSGKTRLGLEVARSLRDQYRDGVWLVELAPLADAELVPRKVAAALGIKEVASRSVTSVLVDALRGRSVLLVLDNCEHVLDGCGELIEALLRIGPDIHILATSREPIDVKGEVVRRLDPLPVPALDASSSATDLAVVPSVRLFVDRAVAVDHCFELSDATASVVAEICRRLDGLPLAIELAAARFGALGIANTAELLRSPLHMLMRGRRTAEARQQTLQATIDWSYRLLSIAEQKLFAQLAIFRGGWTLEAAKQVCSGDGVEKREVVEMLVSLVEKSLVVAEPRPDGGMRYRFLEMLREYAAEHLAASDDDATAARHVAFYTRLSAEAEDAVDRGTNDVVWLTRMDEEYDNMRVALQWCCEHADGESGLRLASHLIHFWTIRGLVREGRDWLHRLLPHSEGTDPIVRAQGLCAMAELAFTQGNLEECQCVSAPVPIES